VGRAPRSTSIDTGLVGVDVGSTTVKLAVRVGTGASWRTFSARHHGRAREALASLCHSALPRTFFIGITGSGAPSIRVRGAVSSHEVAATIVASRVLAPSASSLIDLGGQDAKLVMFEPRAPGAPFRRPATTMNDRCAAGTGVTFERCLARLGIALSDVSTLRYQRSLVHPLSSRCGVFAETDLVNLARRGVAVESLVSSLLDAIVCANLSALARGRSPVGPVLLLGGLHAFVPALADAWRHHLEARWRERGVEPGPVSVASEALYFPAIGAGLHAADEPGCARVTPSELLRALATATEPTPALLDRPFSATPTVTIERPSWPSRPNARDSNAPALSLGVDAGSTVTKAVLLDESGALRMTVRFASGDPATDARAIVESVRASLAELQPPGVLRTTVVTGYGAPWMGPLVGADRELVETVAHAIAARAVAPDADVVCDVGGQDIKLLSLDARGDLLRFELSSRCTAGIGAAIEATARELGVAREAIADRAFSAERVPWLSDACAVFLDADRVSFQRQGFTPEELLAALVRALPRVVWTQVARGAPVASFGRVVVLQGGVQHNRAAVLAQAEHITSEHPGARVIVHPHPDLAGALGAALSGLAEPATRVGRRTLSVASGRATEAAPCALCENRCPRSALELSSDERGLARVVLVGQSCEAGSSEDPREGASSRRAHDHAVPDLYSYEAAALFRADDAVRAVSVAPRRVRVAIPRALAMYRAAPMLRAFLQALGVAARDVVFSPPTSDALVRAGAHRGSTDPCFPAKALVAHAAHLLERERFDVMFVPRVVRAQTTVRHCVDCASCPVVAASPALVRAALGPSLAARGVALLDPELSLSDPAALSEQLFQAFGPLLDATRAQCAEALSIALEASARFDERLRARARAVIERAADGRGVVLVLARPYHVDPGISHRIGVELQNLGYPSLSIRALPRDDAWLRALFADELALGRIEDPHDVRDLFSESDNSGGSERLWGARVAARHGSFGVVDLSSFKCAQDASTSAPIAALLRDSNTPTCTLHDLDESRPRTSLRLGLRTFAHAMRERGLTPWT
jgi:predicted CoA-substrate-specific enzyme activase